jgi:hypothetical protein
MQHKVSVLRGAVIDASDHLHPLPADTPAYLLAGTRDQPADPESGSSTRTAVPAPRRLSTEMRPPSASTRSLRPTRPDDLVEVRLEFGKLRRDRGLRAAQLEGERHEPLLGAVVEIALDPAPGVVGGGHDARPRRGHLRLGLGPLVAGLFEAKTPPMSTTLATIRRRVNPPREARVGRLRALTGSTLYPLGMTLVRPRVDEHPPVPVVAPRPPFVHVPA